MFAGDTRWVVIANSDKIAAAGVQRPGRSWAPTTWPISSRPSAPRKQPICPIEDAFRSTATVQLGMIAYETASTVDWDAASEQIVGNEPAGRLLRREYRSPWTHPYPG